MALECIPLSMMCKFSNQSQRFIDTYICGLNGRQPGQQGSIVGTEYSQQHNGGAGGEKCCLDATFMGITTISDQNLLFDITYCTLVQSVQNFQASFETVYRTFCWKHIPFMASKLTSNVLLSYSFLI
jgi:hypothetical protein